MDKTHHRYPHVFPIPQELQVLEIDFLVDKSTLIIVPENASEHDLYLAHSLSAELSQQYDFTLTIKRVSAIPTQNSYFLIGSMASPLVRAWCQENDSVALMKNTRPEGYTLLVHSSSVVIAGYDDQGAFYGLQSLRQLLKPSHEKATLHIPGVIIRDWPYKEFRGIRLFLPGSDNLSFFRRFIKDFVALYKFNKLIIEVNACMRLDRHPELNAGSIEFAKDLFYRRTSEPINHRGEPQNSAHHDTADGGIVEKAEIAELVRYANLNHIEVIPEIPSLTHSFYLLSRHHELAEIQDIKWPDTYCPSTPQSYALLFDVLDEYIEVMHPKMVHIGHDEWRMAVNVCEKCRGKEYTELFAQDVIKVHKFLVSRGIKVAMWGDHLMESVRNKGWRERISTMGKTYRIPGALSDTQIKRLIPKDILIFNWFWADSEGWLVPQGYRGEDNDIKLEELGFTQVYGNMTSDIENWGRRSSRQGILGGAPSSWAATTEFNLGKDLISELLRCANLLWSTHWPTGNQLSAIESNLYPRIREHLRGRPDPSEDGDSVTPLDIKAHCNIPRGVNIMGQHILGDLTRGQVCVGSKVFHISEDDELFALAIGSAGKEGNPLTRQVVGISVEQDVSSLIFLHTCALPGQNFKAYHEIHNPADTSELLGWYEVVYEDGYVETIPIRYGVNILELCGQSLYGADAVNCAAPDRKQPVYFYAFEWRNPRFGRIIHSVNLKGTQGFRRSEEWYGVSQEKTPSNAIILLAISIVEKRHSP